MFSGVVGRNFGPWHCSEWGVDCIVVVVVIIDDFGGEKIVWFVVVEERLGVFSSPRSEKGGGLGVVHAIFVKAFPNDAETSKVDVLVGVPCFIELFNAVIFVVAKENVVVPCEWITSLLIGKMVDFAGSESCGIIHVGRERGRRGDPAR